MSFCLVQWETLFIMFDRFSSRVVLLQVWGFPLPTQVSHLTHLVWVDRPELSELDEGEGEVVKNTNLAREALWSCVSFVLDTLQIPH